MKHSLMVQRGKVLKLINPLIYPIDLESIDSLDRAIHQMDNYILTKGRKSVGPLIQHSYMSTDKNGNSTIKLEMIRQVDANIVNVQVPYRMNSSLKVSDCMYIHFDGKEDDIKFAYNKIGVLAYEEDIKISDENYTVLIKSDDDNIVADIFVPILHG